MVSDAAVMRSRCEQVDWSKRMANEEARGWRVFVASEMDQVGYVWIDDKAKVQVYGSDTWRLLGQDSRIRYDVIAQCERGAAGIRSLPLYDEPYASLVLSDAVLSGRDGVQHTDRIKALRNRLTRLLEETESVRAQGVSHRGVQIHVLRYEAAERELDELTQELARVQSLLRLVRLVVEEAMIH